MKKSFLLKPKLYLLLITLLLTQTKGNASEYFFASAQTGYSNMFGSAKGLAGSSEYSGGQSYEVSIGMRYHYKQWRFDLAMAYFISGINADNRDINVYNPGINYYHIGIPFKAGYILWESKRCSLSGDLGIIGSCNPGYTLTCRREMQKFPEFFPEERTNKNRWLSLWATVSATATIRITKGLNIVARPQVQCMLTNFYHARNAKATQRNYIAVLELGFSIRV